MFSMRPYLFRALYQWISDSGCTPYLVVNANTPGVVVPRDKVGKDGQIVLNLAERAVEGLDVRQIRSNIAFTAYFSGEPIGIFVPMEAMVAIYAKENGAGMSFPMEDPNSIEPLPEPESILVKTTAAPSPSSSKKGEANRINHGHLKIVKGDLDP